MVRQASYVQASQGQAVLGLERQGQAGGFCRGTVR